MKTSVVRALGLFASVVVAGVASAQSTQAVEWKVSEGGNGHFYMLNTTPMGWHAAREDALSVGADLASLESDQEFNWVKSHMPGHPWPSEGCHLGGLQIPGSSAPNAGWHWLTGAPISISVALEFDDNPCGQGCCGENGEQDYLHSYQDWQRLGDENDGTFSATCLAAYTAYASLVEWSADCNADGVVDYGQIVRGELADLNGNGVPDICETSISSVIPPSVPALGGSAITIRGNGFPQNPAVLIGGVAATNVVRVSSAQITATTPALLPGMASVSVSEFTLADGIYIRPECGSDLDQNGVVDGGDMSILLLDWGQCYATVASPQADDATPFMLQEQTAPPAARSN